MSRNTVREGRRREGGRGWTGNHVFTVPGAAIKKKKKIQKITRGAEVRNRK